jgi:hypothetical protein
VRPAAGDEAAERAQLILLLGRHREHAMRASAHPERERAPRAAADLRPADSAERDARVAEQPQRGEQVAQDRAPAPDRRPRVFVLDRMDDEQVLAGNAFARRHTGGLGEPCDRVALGDREAFR